MDKYQPQSLSPCLSLESRGVGGKFLVNVLNGSLDCHARPLLAKATSEAVAEKRTLILDLSVVVSVDGAGLGILLQTAFICRHQNISFALLSADKRLSRILAELAIPEICEVNPQWSSDEGAVSNELFQAGQFFNGKEWAEYYGPVTSAEAPEGAGPNVIGRRMSGPLRGFGKLWRKCYEVTLQGLSSKAGDLTSILAEKLGQFWPPGNELLLPSDGLKPGAVGAIAIRMPGAGHLYTGLRTIHFGANSFTFSTLEGHMASGWITFSVSERGGCPVVNIISLARTGDPLFEVGFHLFGHKAQEDFWKGTLTRFAEYLGAKPRVAVSKEAVDNKLRWDGLYSLSRNATYNSIFEDAKRLIRGNG